MARHDPHGKEGLGERFSQFAPARGGAGGHDLCSDNDTPALNAHKALCAAPISMGRGETPVELCQQPSVSLLFFFESLWMNRKFFISSRQTENSAVK